MVKGMNKSDAWNYAVGMIKIDNLEPTPEMKKLIEMEKRGEISKDEIYEKLNKHYRMKTG